MIAKTELLRRIKDIVVSEGYSTPLYLGHLLQTLPWYGLSADMERTVYQVLEKIRVETDTVRQSIEMMYMYIQENKHSDY